MTEGERGDPIRVVAGCKPWHRGIFEKEICGFPGRWHFVGERHELSAAAMAALAPEQIFLLHWSWKVPDEIVDRYECVGFHMTDLPYGRGGSPLQNLILRGHRRTKLTAFRLTRELDGGPVYGKEELCLAGGAEEILLRAARLAAAMIGRIVATRPEPAPQEGTAVSFSRRTPAESAIPDAKDLDELHDFLRMLDAQGYPRAFLIHRGFRYEFRRAARYDGRIEATVSIAPAEGPEA